MELHIVGAGLPRTGTASLKQAIEMLTGGSCYHMLEVFSRLDSHGPLWLRALEGETAVFDELMTGFHAAVDWPASAFWPELLQQNPDAVVLLSRRRDPEAWWASVDQTVWETMRRRTGIVEFDALVDGLCRRLGVSDLADAAAAMAAYEIHNQEVRDAVPAGQLLEWEPSDGWAPLCAALGVAVPDEPFPRNNPTSEFRERAGWD